MNILAMVHAATSEHARTLELLHELRSIARDYAGDGEISLDALANATGGAGFTLLGSGYYGAALTHPDAPGKVFKISCLEHDGWARYVRAVAKGCDVAGYAPKVYATTCAFKGCATLGTAAVLDVLDELDDGDDEHQEAEDYVKKALKVALKYAELSFDLHRGNWMRCPKSGRLICTDAIGGDSSAYHSARVKNLRKEYRKLGATNIPFREFCAAILLG